MITKFNQYTNEGVSDYLSPKPKDEIDDVINSYTDSLVKIQSIMFNKLNVHDYFTDEEIYWTLHKLNNVSDKLKYCMRLELDPYDYIDNHEIDFFINDSITENMKISRIIEYGLPFYKLPRRWNGKCIYDGTLYLKNKHIKYLPDNLVVRGNLYISDNNLTKLPKGLKVNGSLNCTNNNLTKLPDDLIVRKYIECYGNDTEQDKLIRNTKAKLKKNE